MEAPAHPSNGAVTCLETKILKLNPDSISATHTDSTLSHLQVTISPSDPTTQQHMSFAAETLRTSSIPLAFPTETVYGLGADATRTSAVQGIYTAKSRPSDNPLIVHISDLAQLRSLLSGSTTSTTSETSAKQDRSSPTNVTSNQHHPPDLDVTPNPIPPIYHPLIARFWPGPLTILIPTSPHLSPLVTAGLSTFGARMPSSPTALALIHLSQRPLAAPSANASTRPSPTRAEHVLHDLDGRIEYILDGGDCDVGVESTVVDGLSVPPAVLRPGGISLKEIRRVRGWEGCVRGYRDAGEADGKTGEEGGKVEGRGDEEMAEQPRAPGMKYKHYAPTARVVLCTGDAVVGEDALEKLIASAYRSGMRRIGWLRGPRWSERVTTGWNADESLKNRDPMGSPTMQDVTEDKFQLRALDGVMVRDTGPGSAELGTACLISGRLGDTAEEMARNLFKALRDMDLHNAETIFVEGLSEGEGEESAAVMNRLKKAAEFRISSINDLRL